MENNPIPVKQLCVITAMFPADNDDEAINYKKKLSAILSSVPEAKVEFRRTNMPQPRTPGLG